MLVELSRRHSRMSHEVEDLAHDLVVAALSRRRALDGDAFLRSAAGAARRHGAFLARSAGRRRVREAASADGTVVESTFEVGQGEGALLSVLPPALKTTLLLLLAGLEKPELRVALGVTDAALRKRFQALRSYAPLARADVPLRPRTAALTRVRKSQIALLPRLAGLVTGPRVLATSDPDGHGLIFAQALTTSVAAATSGALASEPARSKGSPCSTPSSRTSPSSSS